jgi:hypothetical protein
MILTCGPDLSHLPTRRLVPTNAPGLFDATLATSWKVDRLEKIAGKCGTTTLGFIAQIANVLEIALTMLSLERNMMRAAFDFFLQFT